MFIWGTECSTRARNSDIHHSLFFFCRFTNLTWDCLYCYCCIENLVFTSWMLTYSRGWIGSFGSALEEAILCFSILVAISVWLVFFQSMLLFLCMKEAFAVEYMLWEDPVSLIIAVESWSCLKHCWPICFTFGDCVCAVDILNPQSPKLT